MPPRRRVPMRNQRDSGNPSSAMRNRPNTTTNPTGCPVKLPTPPLPNGMISVGSDTESFGVVFRMRGRRMSVGRGIGNVIRLASLYGERQRLTDVSTHRQNNDRREPVNPDRPASEFHLVQSTLNFAAASAYSFSDSASEGWAARYRCTRTSVSGWCK